jgi:TrwC relaxase.
VECELTREFGVAWVPRADGRGNEIAGVTQAQMDAYSTRTVQVHEKERELAQAWERRHGRAPTSRELLYIANDATLRSRKGKDAARVDWDALAARWDATLGGHLRASRPQCRTRAARTPPHRQPSLVRGRRVAVARGAGPGGAEGAGAGVGEAVLPGPGTTWSSSWPW